jgi:AcrR family transcriptional regulator
MSPRTPKQFQDIREEKKTLIMDVALEHFANEGYYRTTINHIARHAGISKGLMYNYFESKESLLSEIIARSVSEVYTYFDIDKDGSLSEEEFEFFVKRVVFMLKEKQSFWRLYLQLMMQNEVRELLLKSFINTDSLKQYSLLNKSELFVSEILKTITDYFIRKKKTKGPDYDPSLEMNMFMISLKGLAISYIYMDTADDINYDKTVNRIIELYK